MTVESKEETRRARRRMKKVRFTKWFLRKPMLAWVGDRLAKHWTLCRKCGKDCGFHSVVVGRKGLFCDECYKNEPHVLKRNLGNAIETIKRMKPFSPSPETRERIDEICDQEELELLTMPGYDDCIVGIGRQFNKTFVVYHREKVIEKLVGQGMSWDEAEEFHEFNQAGSWNGEATPCFLVIY